MIRRRKQLYIYLLLPFIVLLAAMITVGRAWQENLPMAQKKLRWYTLLARIYTQAAFITLLRAVKSKRVPIPTQLPRLTRRQALSYVVIIAMLFAMMPAMTVTAEAAGTAETAETWSYPTSVPANPFAGGDGTAKEPYLISTAQQLANLSYLVNQGSLRASDSSSYASMHYQLTADLVLNDVTNWTSWSTESYYSISNKWIPIGKDSSHQFKGNFNGNGHTISGIYVFENIYGGVFGYTSRPAENLICTIKNLGVTSSFIHANSFAGGIVGCADYTKISNCYSTAKVHVGDQYAGGIAGSVSIGEIKNCYSTASITGGNSGGLVGQIMSATLQNSYWYPGSQGIGVDRGSTTYGACASFNSAGTLTAVSGHTIIDGSTTLVTALNSWVGQQDSSLGYHQWYTVAGLNSGFPVMGNIPVANTAAATSIKSTGATLNATVNANNASTTVTFEYGTTTSYGTTIAAIESPVTGSAITSVSAIITGLQPSTTYHFWVKAVNAEGTSTSTDSSFSTLAPVYDTWTAAAESAVSGASAGQGDYYYDESSATYTINTATGLAWVANMTNSGATLDGSIGFLGKTVVLGNNIDLDDGTVTNYGTDADTSWIPIGIGDMSYPKPFKGTFDGKGYTISNLKINNSTATYQGLFGQITGGIIRNVGIASGSIEGNYILGGLAGSIDNSTIENCYNKATINGVEQIGGIAGRLYARSSIEDCYNTAAMSANTKTVGGIAGYLDNAWVKMCYNTGNISVGNIGNENVRSIGGIAGYNTNSLIKKCVSFGSSLSATIGQTTGRIVYNTGTCEDNYAWSGMTVNGSIITSGTTSNYHGEDITISSEGALSTQFSAVFGATNSAWTMADNKLPILTGFATGSQSSDLPSWIVPDTAPSITTTSLADGTVGKTYSKTLTATGTTPITWSIVSGSLPSGLSLNTSTGVISGTPSAAETSSITVKATNSAGNATKSLSLEIKAVQIYDSWTAAAQAAASGTDYTISGNTYTILTSNGLAWVAWMINTNQNSIDGFKNKTIQLANHLDLNDGTVTNYGSNAATSWIPIGTSEKPFKGTFDGKGHTISNVKIKNPDASYQGFFGVVAGMNLGSNACEPIIRNVGIASGSVQGKESVGGLAGFISYGTIQNCYNKATVSGTTEIGGIVGKFRWKSLIQDCYNTANISGSNNHVGGIVGYIDSSTDVATIKNCYNTGTINGAYCVGGIAGYNSADIVTNCVSFGSSLSAVSALIAGRIAYADGTYTDNYAWSGMTVNGSIITSGAISNSHGEDITISSEGALSTQFSTVFGTTTPAIWTFEDNKMPILAGFSGTQSSTLPDRSASSSPDTDEEEDNPSSGGDSNTGGSSRNGGSSNTNTTDDTDNTDNTNFTDIDGTINIKGDIIKGKDDEDSVLNLQIDDEKIVLPTDAIDLEEILDRIGEDADASDIEIRFNIKEPTDGEKKIIKDATDKAGLRIVIPGSKFEINVSYEDTTYPADKDDFYIERTLPIPEDIDSKDITSAIAIDEKGNIHHVPTKIIIVDGKTYVVIKSTYSWPIAFVSNPANILNTMDHWAQASINGLSSRMIFTGLSGTADEAYMYYPEKGATRAEFTASLMNALGLAPGIGETDFIDIDSSAWYYQYLQTASHYGIIKGYGDGTFAPQEQITREQAMTMVYQAMKLAGLDVVLTEEEGEVLLEQYQDKSLVSTYANPSITTCLKTGVIIGRSKFQLAPGQTITRAEVAVLIEKFLQRSNLI